MPANNQAVDTPGDSALAQRLRREVTGDVFFDAFNRGRYATDASFYQILPAGVVVPRTVDEALRTLAIARDDGRIVTPRGGGTSQCGQTVNTGIVVDVDWRHGLPRHGADDGRTHCPAPLPAAS